METPYSNRIATALVALAAIAANPLSGAEGSASIGIDMLDKPAVIAAKERLREAGHSHVAIREAEREALRRANAALAQHDTAALAEHMPAHFRSEMLRSMDLEQALRQQAAATLELAKYRLQSRGFDDHQIAEAERNVKESVARIEVSLAGGSSPADILYALGVVVPQQMPEGCPETQDCGEPLACTIARVIAASRKAACEAEAESEYQSCLATVYMTPCQPYGPSCHSSLDLMAQCASRRNTHKLKCVLIEDLIKRAACSN